MTGRRRPGGEKRGGLPIEGIPAGRIPFVAIVGRPNAGKSTLFNRLVRSRLSIVDDTPGVTRDRLYAEATIRGRPVGLIDTGGVEAEGADDPMAGRIRLQVRVAIEEADAVICLFDGRGEPSADDACAVDMLRRSDRPVVWAVNKVDSPKDEPGASEYHALGIDSLLPVSAASGAGIGALVDAVMGVLPPAETAAVAETAEAEFVEGEEAAEAPPEEPIVPRIAVIGRPNVGKSTLVNRLLGEDRMIVDDRPGTTRDAVDSRIETRFGPMILIDTAGLRKRARIAGRIERLSALSAVRALERCHVAVLLVDGTEGRAGEQDKHLAGLAAERGRALVVGVNKVDEVRGTEAQRELDREMRRSLAFVPWAPVVFVSARAGRGVPALVEAVDRVHAASNRRVTTSALNRFLDSVVTQHSPPLWHNRPVQFYYAAQVAVRPPTFIFFASRPDGVHPSYVRYLENQLRERFGLEGCPVRLRFRRGRDERV